jgi:hypothetical protein
MILRLYSTLGALGKTNGIYSGVYNGQIMGYMSWYLYINKWLKNTHMENQNMDLYIINIHV